jgi:hypothetical protein
LSTLPQEQQEQLEIPVRNNNSNSSNNNNNKNNNNNTESSNNLKSLSEITATATATPIATVTLTEKLEQKLHSFDLYTRAVRMIFDKRRDSILFKRLCLNKVQIIHTVFYSENRL